MNKVTKMWTMASGKKVRICDMSNEHLANTILMLKREAKRAEDVLVGDLLEAGRFVRGDHAVEDVEDALGRLTEHGFDPSNVSPLYDDLWADYHRRVYQKLWTGAALTYD